MLENHPMRRLCFLIGLVLSLLLLNIPAWSGKPDLQVQFLDIGPTVPNPPLTDRPTSFYALVVNAGTQNIKGPFIVTCVLDGKAVKAWHFPVKKEIKDYKPGTENSIPPGKGRLYQYVATLKEGKHTVRWHVDTAAKNEIKATVEAQQAPDLVVNIWPTGERVLAYQETEWNVEVKNIGGGKASGPFVTLFRSVPASGPVPLLVFPPDKYLAKDEAYTFKVNQLYNSLDPVTVSAIVDYHGDVTEALPFGDDNNSIEKKYVPQYVDLEVSALEIKPAQLTTAEPVEVSCTIENKGNMDAAKPFNVGILVKEVSSGAISLIDAIEATALPAGQSEQLTKKISLSRAGTYAVQVIADAAMIGPNPNVIGKQYSEPDTANNAKEEQFTVSPAAAPAPATVPPEESPDQTEGGPLARVTSGCKPGKGVVKLYRIISECSTGSTQPYTGFIPAIKKGSLKRVTNTTTQWKVKLVDSFNLKGSGESAQCEKYGGHCWELIPRAFLAPGESWVNSSFISLNGERSINACLEPLTNDPFPLEIEIEYEYECLQ
jgi:CARDB